MRAGRADQSILHSESVYPITLLSRFAKFVAQSSLIRDNKAQMVWLVIIMVPKAGIKSFKFFWAVEVPMQGIHHGICHFAPLADFLQVSVDHSPSQKKRNHIRVVSVTLSPRGISHARSSAVLKIHFALLVDLALPEQ